MTKQLSNGKIGSMGKNFFILVFLFVSIVVNAIQGNTGFKVLLLSAAGDDYNADVKKNLDSSGYFSAVDIFAAEDSTPTLKDLTKYDVVMVFSDDSFWDEVAIGDTMAAFIEAGGSLVDAVFENASIPALGAFDSAYYRVLIPDDQNDDDRRVLGEILLPDHYIMANVKSFDGGESSYRSSSDSLAPGAYPIALYDNGEILVAAKDSVGSKNVHRVSLNFYPPSSGVRDDFWDTLSDGVQLMANSLMWVTGKYITGDYYLNKDSSSMLSFIGPENVTIVKWQEKFGSSGWVDLNSTAKIMNISPDQNGTWKYRVMYKSDTDSGFTGNFKVIVKDFQRIDFAKIPVTYKLDDTLKLLATATSGLNITYVSSDTSVAVISNDTAFVKKIGTTIITAYQEGNHDYFAADSVNQVLRVRQAGASIVLTVSSGIYDGNVKTITTAPTPDTLAVKITYNGSEEPPVDAGIYEVIAEIDDTLFFAEDIDTLYIEKAELTITADDKTREEGASNPVFTLAYSGFITGDSESDLDVLPVASCSANAESAAGAYPITLSGGSDNNYTFILVNGELTVTAAPLSTDQVISNEINIYPNPVLNVINVMNCQSGIYKIIDITGNVVQSGLLENNSINVSNLQKGLYMLEIQNVVIKIIKQ